MSKQSLLLCMMHLTSALAAAPLIRLKAGTVRGTTCPDIATSVYRGIPFAEPPVGKLRFMPTVPLSSSYTYPNGELNATQFGPTCIQWPGDFPWVEPSTSEDCLTLTVYVPPGRPSGLPVKVWTHGGSDTDGSASYPLYDLCHMATDSIGVALQYRLGALGWLALDAAGIEGNQGIQDMMTALEWIQANIAAFGGDPKKVLLFGQSSGADNSYALSTLPQAKSLISSVICESGGGLDLTPNVIAQKTGEMYAKALKCAKSDLSCLQSKSVAQLLNQYARLPSYGQGSFKNNDFQSWSAGNYPKSTILAGPILDGKYFTKQPLEVGPQVPIMLGSTTNDGSLFVTPVLLGFLHAKINLSSLQWRDFTKQFAPQTAAVRKQYPLSAYGAKKDIFDAVIDDLTAIQTAFAFTCFTYRGLRSAANSGVPAYAYSFGHQLSCPWLWNNGSEFPTTKEDAIFPQPMHTAEIPLVLGGLDNLPWGNGTCNLTSSEYALSASMRSSWTAMAATGKPSISGLSWPAFDECSTQGVYYGDQAMVQKIDFSECEFWDQVQANFGGVDFPYPTCAAGSSNTTNGQ